MSEITSIADVDERIAQSSVPDAPFLSLKHLYQMHPLIEERFQERRDIHLQALQYSSIRHQKGFEQVFWEINREISFRFGSGRVHTFLDLGCSPGGFSNWLLKHNCDARGLGITLPDEDANSHFRSTVPSPVPVARDVNPIIPIGGGGSVAEPFDLIIAGIFPVLENHVPWWHRVQIALAQTLIILSNVAHGGSCVMVINTKPFLWLIEVVELLSRVFVLVTTSKGGKLHRVRSSCYLICRDFKATKEEVERYTGQIRTALLRLESLPSEAAIDGPDVEATSTGTERWKQYGGDPGVDAPLISDASASDLFESECRIMLDLFEPMWAAQFNAIRDDLAYVLASHYGDNAYGQDEFAIDDASGGPESKETEQSTISPWMAMTPPQSPLSPFKSAVGVQTTGTGFDFRSHVQPPAPPSSPVVPKWRAPHRRMSTSGGPSDADEWRRRNTEAVADLGIPRKVGAGPGGGRFRSQSSAADSSTWWRQK
ncbi:hypothetical protein A0H81_02043 [Grifola frondosa]|uniref:Ribosomal RNA methyltransferase FtsJ domain-containing protein n=1 Tax=Grifola frondosa TaxID=5627 RepID=A0A1C7MK15_GRIFR|nr:hypothetical protein A0H81_02043 [Grifola frondosa]